MQATQSRKLWNTFKTDYSTITLISKNMSDTKRIETMMQYAVRLGAAARTYVFPDVNQTAIRIHIMLAIDGMRFNIPYEWHWSEGKFRSFVIECLQNAGLTSEEIKEVTESMPRTI